jgi:flagellum-specific peptidoglycan hydrolase FlgJ
LAKYFNFGGVKDFSGKGIQKDTTEYVAGKKQSVSQPFRRFNSLSDYINYKINLVGDN